jgi:hypothetical protein
MYTHWRDLVTAGVRGDIENFREALGKLMLALGLLFKPVPIDGEVVVYKIGDDEWIVRIYVPGRDYDKLLYIEGTQSILTVLRTAKEKCVDLFREYDLALSVLRRLVDLYLSRRIQQMKVRELGKKPSEYIMEKLSQAEKMLEEIKSSGESRVAKVRA